MNKEELRAVYRQIRLRMSPSQVASQSRMISRKLLTELDWSKYPKVCVYQSIANLNEVNIEPLVRRLGNQPNIELSILSSGKKAKPPKGKFDLILVPCLAFDKDNYRLGWGGGFYDRFLAAQPQALKIGLCFKNGYAEKLPREPHDIPLDRVITEI